MGGEADVGFSAEGIPQVYRAHASWRQVWAFELRAVAFSKHLFLSWGVRRDSFDNVALTHALVSFSVCRLDRRTDPAAKAALVHRLIDEVGPAVMSNSISF
jgi:hypothetical protein